MELSYDKAAFQEYMDDISLIGESMRRTKDESSMLYISCKQQYTRLYTKLEQAIRKAYNMVESAESMQRSADAEYDLAMRLLEDAEDDSVQETARRQLHRAQELRAEAEAEMATASDEYSKAQSDMKRLTDVWEKYQLQLESVAQKVEDGLSSFITVVNNGNHDLGEYIGIMDKAQAALYGDSSASSTSSLTANSSKNAILVSDSFQTKAGNTLGAISEAGVASIIMNVAGRKYSFPNTKSGAAKAYRTALESGDQEMIARTEALFKHGFSAQKGTQNDKWNSEYMPLIKANIRQSVATHFAKYVSQEKLEQCLDALGFMDQGELRHRYESRGGEMPIGVLGYNDGKSSNIANDMRGITTNGRVGNHQIEGSGNTNINYAFVTAVHENLHMMSANDLSGETRRGIMVGNDEKSRAMNEAFTEYFTYISCGGENSLGGLYPGSYSGYQILMKEMPTIERAVGRDCMMDAYFNNNSQRLRQEIDGILGRGAWDDMCLASYDIMYNENANGGYRQLISYLNRLQDS